MVDKRDLGDQQIVMALAAFFSPPNDQELIRREGRVVEDPEDVMCGSSGDQQHDAALAAFEALRRYPH